MAKAKRGGQGFILQLDYCYPLLRLVLNSCPSLYLLLRRPLILRRWCFAKTVVSLWYSEPAFIFFLCPGGYRVLSSCIVWEAVAKLQNSLCVCILMQVHAHKCETLSNQRVGQILPSNSLFKRTLKEVFSALSWVLFFSVSANSQSAHSTSNLKHYKWVFCSRAMYFKVHQQEGSLLCQVQSWWR